MMFFSFGSKLFPNDFKCSKFFQLLNVVAVPFLVETFSQHFFNFSQLFKTFFSLNDATVPSFGSKLFKAFQSQWCCCCVFFLFKTFQSFLRLSKSFQLEWCYSIFLWFILVPPQQDPWLPGAPLVISKNENRPKNNIRQLHKQTKDIFILLPFGRRDQAGSQVHNWTKLRSRLWPGVEWGVLVPWEWGRLGMIYIYDEVD